MTLDKGIIHLREIAEQYNKWAEENKNGEIWEREDSRLYKEAAKEYFQYVEWLEELKHYKEQKSYDDCISREAALKESYHITIDGDTFEVVQVETLLGLPPVQSKQETERDKENI